MKTKFRGLVLTAMMLSGSTTAMAEDGAQSVVGDIPGYGEEAYFHEEAAYAEEDNYPENYVGDNEVAPASHSEVSAAGLAPLRAAAYVPVAVSQLQPISCPLGKCSSSSPCDTGCDDGCGPAGCDGGCDGVRIGRKHKKKLLSIFDRCHGNTWATSEALLWFVQDQDTVPLVSTSDVGTEPIINFPGSNTESVFGDPLEGELSAGFRTDIGAWLTSNVGVGGRFWILSENADEYNAAGDGSDRSIGRPFFNTDIGNNDAVRIALDGTFQGSVEAESELDIWAAEAYGRLRFGCSRSCQLDFIGGYSHFEIDDSLRIDSTTINTIPSGANPAGTVRTFSDRFDVENLFNGGQIGFEMVMKRGRWMARSLTKVHLGNMNQSVDIFGTNTRQIPGSNQTASQGGILASADSVSAERDVFAFAPEANFKLGYRFRPNVLLSVGYSFIYWDNVALSGDQIDPKVSGNFIGTGVAGPFPQFTFDDSSLWVQGVDLGVIIDF